MTARADWVAAGAFVAVVVLAATVAGAECPESCNHSDEVPADEVPSVIVCTTTIPRGCETFVVADEPAPRECDVFRLIRAADAVLGLRHGLLTDTDIQRTEGERLRQRADRADLEDEVYSELRAVLADCREVLQ